MSARQFPSFFAMRLKFCLCLCLVSFLWSLSPIYSQSNLFETVVYLGCKNAEGKTIPQEVVDAVFNAFAAPALSVCRVNSTTSMVYWGEWASSLNAMIEDPNCFSTAGLLLHDDGRCGAWASLFSDVIKAQGIPGCEDATVVPLDDPSEELQGVYVLVKNWDLSNLSDPVKLPGIPGQSQPSSHVHQSCPC